MPFAAYTAEEEKGVIDAGKALLDEGGTPQQSLFRFRATIERLFETAAEVNRNIQPSPPVSTFMVEIANRLVQNMEDSAFEPIADTFVLRACPLIDDIKNKNLDVFLNSAKSVFEGIPDTVVLSVSEVIRNRQVPQESLDRFFEIIHALCRMTMKRACMIAYEESGLRKTNPLFKYSVDIKGLAFAFQRFSMKATVG